MNQKEDEKALVSPLILKQCESIIEGELANLKNLVRAFEVIKEMELYSDEYNDFQSYYTSRWKTIINLDTQGELTLNIKKDKK